MIVLYGASWCGDCHRSRGFLDSKDIAYTFVNIDEDAEGAANVEELNDGNRSIPTIVFDDGSILVEPGNVELEEKLKSLGILSEE